MALNSKRMQTFFNEFLITTTTFLNQFTNECECKFFEFERKLNRIESNLIIIEAKLQSVPLEDTPTTSDSKVIQNTSNKIEVNEAESSQKIEATVKSEIDVPTPEDQKTPEIVSVEPNIQIDSNLIKISESFHYKRFFKMIKFGVPAQAVKLKMISEELDGEKLDNPDLLIERIPEDDENFEES